MIQVIKILIAITLLASTTVYGRPDAESKSLPLSCFAVPSAHYSICSAQTYAANNISTDLLLYQSDQYDNFRLIGVSRADIGIQWLWGVSASGKYTILVSSEEGHSTYVVFLTRDVLNSQDEGFDHPVAVVSDYFLSDLIYLHDNGTAIFARLGGKTDAPADTCQSSTAYLSANIDLDADACYVEVNISDWSVSKAD